MWNDIDYHITMFPLLSTLIPVHISDVFVDVNLDNIRLCLSR